MFYSGLIGVVIYALYPVAPPRLLDVGLVDTVTEQSVAYRVLQPPGLVNKYAAVPSLHAGWNLLVGLAIYQAASARGWKIMGVVGPVAMTLAVVVTANHFVLDVVIGLAVAMIGYVIARRAPLRRPRWRSVSSSKLAGDVQVVEDDTIDAPASQTSSGLDIRDRPGIDLPPSLVEPLHEVGAE